MKKVGAYLPGAYEEVVDVVDAYVLTDKVGGGGGEDGMRAGGLRMVKVFLERDSMQEPYDVVKEVACECFDQAEGVMLVQMCVVCSLLCVCMLWV